MTGNAYVEGLNQILGGNVLDTAVAGAQTGGVTGAQNAGIYDISAAQGVTANTTDSAGAVGLVADTASTGMQLVNNAVAGSEQSSGTLAAAVGDALQNRSQSSLQAGGQTLLYLAIAGVAGFVLWGIFRGHK